MAGKAIVAIPAISIECNRQDIITNIANFYARMQLQTPRPPNLAQRQTLHMQTRYALRREKSILLQDVSTESWKYPNRPTSRRYSPISACRNTVTAVGSNLRISAVDLAVTPKPYQVSISPSPSSQANIPTGYHPYSTPQHHYARDNPH